jgi:hypothetical protein
MILLCIWIICMNILQAKNRLTFSFLLISVLTFSVASSQNRMGNLFFNQNVDTLPRPRLHFSFALLFSPKNYKVFDNDPIDLFTRTGLHAGVNVLYRLRPSRPDSSGWLQMIGANYGITRGAFNVEYVGIFHQLIGPWDLLFKSRFDDPAVENYFDTGNETIKPNSKTYNRTKSTRFYVSTGISGMLADHHHAELSVFYQMVKEKKTMGHFISENPGIDSSVFINKKFEGAEAGYRYRKVNDNNFPTLGIDFSLGLGFIKTLSEAKSFGKILSSFSFYVPLGRSFSFASRIGGATQGSNVDFYYLNKLGGYVNLRGYLRERFYGKTIFYNNNDFRWVTPARISSYNGKIGLLVFFDEGRVWQPGEVSKTMHTGYGGGLIVIPVSNIVLTGTVTHSKENTLIEAKAGLFF